MRLIDADEIHFVFSRGNNSTILQEVLLAILAESPTVDAEPVRHGRWIKDPHSQNGFPSHIYMMRKCSECGHSVDNATPYCPWCGAKMDAERKEE